MIGLFLLCCLADGFYGLQSRLSNKINIEPRLDVPYRILASGFWYLHDRQPDKAQDALVKVRHLAYGEEIYALSNTLNLFYQNKDIDHINQIEIPSLPPPLTLLWPTILPSTLP